MPLLQKQNSLVYITKKKADLLRDRFYPPINIDLLDIPKDLL